MKYGCGISRWAELLKEKLYTVQKREERHEEESNADKIIGCFSGTPAGDLSRGHRADLKREGQNL
jgi:hypothetical protein